MQGNGRPVEVYRTKFGKAVLTKAEDYLPLMPANSVDLVVTSPPFALLRQKAYGNLDQADYVDWLVSFGPLVRRVLKDTGTPPPSILANFKTGWPWNLSPATRGR
jgi:site-specific DNA-methyltransferase (cytosine-N4-specific)